MANQIAAGEVVQRPANALKELIENAIDADATELYIYIQDSGKTKISVRDNGIGMQADDAVMCFERHATSKISNAADLFRISTKGFRGEALASMAAVAKIELITGTEAQGQGRRICIEDGNIISNEPVSCDKGTQITLKHLFYNVPARRNFLKSDTIEFRHILEEIERLALAHPHIEFKLTHNKTEILHWPATSDILRIRQVLGTAIDSQVVPVHESTSYLKINGFVGLPQFALKVRKDQYLFINGRFVRYPYLHHAVLQAYEHLIPEGHQPKYILFLTVQPQHVDVNIHPTKTEVKLDDERTAFQLLLSMVKRALGKANAGPSLDFNSEMGFMDVPNLTQKHLEAPKINYNPDYHPEFNPKPKTSAISWDTVFKDAAQIHEPPIQKLNLDSDTNSTFFLYAKRYLVFPQHDGIVLMDIRRARERIRYEYYLTNSSNTPLPAQELLFPEHFELSASAAQWMRDWQKDLLHFGIRIEPFGGQHFILYALPSGITYQEAKDWMEQLRETCLLNRDQGITDVRVNLCRTLARTDSWNSLWVQENDIIMRLRHDLNACENTQFSPSGKPIFMLIKDTDIRSFFKS